ncbi:hypothetical protein ACS5PU_03395 [Pedobacter sp. GSP4]|uniref:hypothetical protein n=1 Tax=Pedobacter sp. GSP4 TaxID=3453716 RepID=UPI003EEF19F8
MKRNFRLTALIAIIIIGCFYSCKKDNEFKEKPSPEEIVKAPEKFGYELVKNNEIGLKQLDRQNLDDNKITAYYNSKENSTLLVNNNATANLPGRGPVFEFSSYESIQSGDMQVQAPNIVDDSNEYADFGLISLNEVAWVLTSGRINVSKGSTVWFGADMGSFKLNGDEQFENRIHSLRSAIGVDPIGWIVETNRY